MDSRHIRNFCIIAHIDHGKSTLADRILQVTGAVEARDMVEQVLDTMDLERERGITIKAQAVRMTYESASGLPYQLNLIDTPGHVDFSYEVSRSLAACEGALLVVDAAQGIQAQTLANVYLAMEHDLEIVPVINKIDLVLAEPERVALEVQQAFGFSADEIVFASAKDGTGVTDILEAIVSRVPPPRGDDQAPLRALIFDSKYDSYKGVVAYVRIVDGAVPPNSRLRMMSADTESDALEVGVFRPHPTGVDRLEAGEVGYIATGLKRVGDAPVGDTVTLAQNGAREPLKGYQPLKPMVFAGLYPADGEEYLALRDALEKLKLNDGALVFQPESSLALGSGFRCGFLGLLHMDIVQQRLEQESDLDLVQTAPNVTYEIDTKEGQALVIHTPQQVPEAGDIEEFRHPIVRVSFVLPVD
ncbi:MAG: translation elongation factor 4, partial [SAR202 cluster bacterium]|nr:translation elongation factor 4 [SAR202 cluster bacterium]